jgi:hypothetical protein
MDVLFKAVHEKLTKVEAIRWVDEDWGQLDIYENPPVTFPCALVSVQVPEWIPIKEPAVQPGKAQVIIKIGFDTRYKTGNAPTEEITRAFAHFAIVKAVTLALRGMTGDTFRGLERLSTLKTVTEAGVKIYTVIFSSSIAEVIEAPEEE